MNHEIISLLKLFQTDEGHLLFWPSVCFILLTSIAFVALFLAVKSFFRYARLGEIFDLKYETMRSDDSNSVIADRPEWKQPISGFATDLERGGGSAVLHEVVGRYGAMESSRMAQSFLAFSIGAVLILGLAGTFAAFAELIDRSGLGTTRNMEDGINTVVRNLELSFLTSITGVVCSVILHFFSTVVVKPARLNYLIKLEMFGEEYYRHLGSSTITAGNTDEGFNSIADSLKAAIPALSKAAERLESASKSTPEEIADALLAIKDEMSKSESRFASILQTAEKCEKALNGVGDTAKGLLEKQVQDFAEKQSRIFEKADGIAEYFAKEVENQNKESIKAFQSAIALLGVGIEKQTGKISDMSEVLQKSMADDRKVTHDLVRNVSQQVSDKLTENTTAAISRLEDAFKGSIGDWNEQIALAKQQRDHAKQMLETVRGGLDSLAGHANDIVTNSTKSLDKLSSSAQKLEEVPKKLGDSVGMLSEGIGHMQGSADRLELTVDKIRTDAEGIFKGMANRLDSLDRQLEQAIEIGKRLGLRPKRSLVDIIMFWKKP
jgi:hypothetical protein